jgi:predicted TIM-barrel fold metal-dependent hydrolase
MIDAHVHIGRPPGNGFKNLSHEQVRDQLLIEMAANGIDKAIVLTRRHHGQTSSPVVDERLLALTEGTGRLAVVATVNPAFASSADLHELGVNLGKKRVVGIKLYLGYQHFYPADEVCRPVYELALRHNVPVVFHTGDVFVSTGTELLKFAHPLGIDEVATRYPELKIVMAHLGNPWIADCAGVLSKNKNVYADLSGLFVHEGAKNGPTPRYQAVLRQQIEHLIAYAGGERLLYGSDWPLIGMEQYQRFVESLNLPVEDHERIFGGNASRLFGI